MGQGIGGIGVKRVVLGALLALVAGVADAQKHPVSAEVRAVERLYRSHDYAGAVAASDAVLAAHPDDPVALGWRAYSLVELGEYRRALPDFDRSLRLAPDSPNAWNNACWARALLGEDLDRALEYCDHAVELAPGPALLDTRAFLRLRLRRGEYARAVRDYSDALRMYAKLSDALYGRGIARLRLGEEAAGRADIAAAVKLEPGVGERYARQGVTVD